MRKGGPDEFRERMRRTAQKLNELVFSNGEDCKAYREEVASLLPDVRADLAYFDLLICLDWRVPTYFCDDRQTVNRFAWAINDRHLR